jgi:hypothetical protein
MWLRKFRANTESKPPELLAVEFPKALENHIKELLSLRNQFYKTFDRKVESALKEHAVTGLINLYHSYLESTPLHDYIKTSLNGVVISREGGVTRYALSEASYALLSKVVEERGVSASARVYFLPEGVIDVVENS